MTYHVFTITPDGAVTHGEQPKAPELDQLQALVGGYIELIPGFHKLEYNGKVYSRGQAFADEDGHRKRLTLNQRASIAWRKSAPLSRGQLVGPVVFCAKEPRNA